MTSVVRRRQIQDDSGEFSDTSSQGKEGAGSESDYDSRGSVDSDASDQENSGNQEAEKRVDDDEDRSNPQYIPKRGTFYEHDDRTASGGEETTVSTTEGDKASEKDSDTKPSETTSERRRGPRKSEACDKWSHDRYIESEQKPKTREELIAIYGYDIRNEDAPPHARRNRRYGRGPNKYTRTWQDEEAYKRQASAAVTNHKKPPNLDEFPDLEKSSKRNSSTRKPRPPRSRSQPNTNSNESLENGAQLRRNASIKVTKTNPKQNLATRNLSTKDKMASKVNQNLNRSVPVTKSGEKMPAIENLTISTNSAIGGQSVRKVNTVQSQQKPIFSVQPTPTVPVKRTPTTSASTQQNSTSRNENTTRSQQQPQKSQTQPTQPTGNENKSGIKRYSSLRQRPLGENYSSQTQHRFAPEYQPQTTTAPTQIQTSNVSQIHQQQKPIHQQYHEPSPLPQQVRSPQPAHGPSPPHLNPLPPNIPANIPSNIPSNIPANIPQAMPQQQQIAQPPLPQQVRLIEQQQMVTHPHAMHNISQPHTIPQLPPPTQPYAAPTMMPAQYIQGGNTPPVYGNTAMYAQPPAPYPHQMYPHHNYTTASGVTYYNPEIQVQEPQPRVSQRRPTAAIPIVKPSNSATQDATLQPTNSSENENIDRIVDNMFVRKPWQASRDSTKKENRSSQEANSKESTQPNSLTSSIESRASAERIEPTTTLNEVPKTDEKTIEVKAESTRSEEIQRDETLPTNEILTESTKIEA